MPGSDELKHLGAAMASFGSVPLFHLVDVTPEAPDIDAIGDPATLAVEDIGAADFEAVCGEYGAKGERVDVVVFSVPQLSLIELSALADMLDGKRLHPKTMMLAVTSLADAADARRLGLATGTEGSGALFFQGICFYQSYAREMAEANGWTRLLTNSAKLVNIIGGYGYKPTLASMANCVASAVAGEIV